MVSPLNSDYILNEYSLRKEIDWRIERETTSMWQSSYIEGWLQLNTEWAQKVKSSYVTSTQKILTPF
jgi:hypothetical protein